MSIKLEVIGCLGKDPYVQTISNRKVTILSLACRRANHSRVTDWVTGSIWDEQLANYVRTSFKKGDTIKAFGTLSNLMVYFDGAGKAKPGLDFFINSIGFVPTEKEN
jgi:single-stranded DNA-binding protein